VATTANHPWANPVRPDPYRTFRACVCCDVVKERITDELA